MGLRGSPTSNARWGAPQCAHRRLRGRLSGLIHQQQPISPGPNEQNERANEAKVLLSTGTTMNSEAQAERIASRESPCRRGPVSSALIRNRLERIARPRVRGVRCSFSAWMKTRARACRQPSMFQGLGQFSGVAATDDATA